MHKDYWSVDQKNYLEISRGYPTIWLQNGAFCQKWNLIKNDFFEKIEESNIYFGKYLPNSKLELQLGYREEEGGR